MEEACSTRDFLKQKIDKVRAKDTDMGSAPDVDMPERTPSAAKTNSVYSIERVLDHVLATDMYDSKNQKRVDHFQKLLQGEFYAEMEVFHRAISEFRKGAATFELEPAHEAEFTGRQ